MAAAQELKHPNPEQPMGKMMGANPQFAAFVNRNKGEGPEQIARGNGIDFNMVQKMFKWTARGVRLWSPLELYRHTPATKGNGTAMSEYPLSDIATASRENGFGGDTAWCMTVPFTMTFGRGGNGFGFGNRMADMRNRINRLQLSQAPCGAVRYPNTFAYNAGPSPFCGNGCRGTANI